MDALPQTVESQRPLNRTELREGTVSPASIADRSDDLIVSRDRQVVRRWLIRPGA